MLHAHLEHRLVAFLWRFVQSPGKSNWWVYHCCWPDEHMPWRGRHFCTLVRCVDGWIIWKHVQTLLYLTYKARVLTCRVFRMVALSMNKCILAIHSYVLFCSVCSFIFLVTSYFILTLKYFTYLILGISCPYSMIGPNKAPWIYY